MTGPIPAEILVKDNRFTWNSGIFMFKATTILNEVEKFYPNLIKNCRSSLDKKLFDLDFQRLDKKASRECSNVSIDVAVMEKTKNAYVFPLNVGWSDIGSWQTLWMNGTKAKDQNVVIGKVLKKEAKNCYLRSESRLIAALGVEDLIVVENNDSILKPSDNFTNKDTYQMINLFMSKYEKVHYDKWKKDQETKSNKVDPASFEYRDLMFIFSMAKKNDSNQIGR